MDDLDRRILNILLEDAHTPFREMAARADTTVGTIHNRIKRLRETGVLRRVVADVDAAAAGFPVCALVELKTEAAHHQEVQRALAGHARVVAVYDVTGDMDALVVGKFRDTSDLDRFVKSTRAHPHVKETRTRLALNIVKESLAPDPGAP